MDTHLDLVRALVPLSPTPMLMGGVAEDAVLHGRMTRPHSDVDLVVPRDELLHRVEQGRALGFEDFMIRMQIYPEMPLVVGAVEGNLNLELVVFERDADGRLFIDVPTPRGVSRLWMPDGAEDAPPVALDGVEVRTLSPLALYHIRAGVAETFGGFRPKDRIAQAALRAGPLAGASKATLTPRVERLDPLTATA